MQQSTIDTLMKRIFYKYYKKIKYLFKLNFFIFFILKTQNKKIENKSIKKCLSNLFCQEINPS